MDYSDLTALLKKNGASLTRPRKVVFDLLYGQQPLSMEQLISGASGKIDRASVYRTIEVFEKLGIVHRLNIGFKYKIELSDVFKGHHHHFYCTNCAKTYELPGNPLLEAMIDSTVAREGFAARGHQLEIYGVCKDCQA